MDGPAFLPAYSGGVRERAAAVVEAVDGMTDPQQRETSAHLAGVVPHRGQHALAVRALRSVVRRRGRFDLRDRVGRIGRRRVRGVEGVSDRRRDDRLVAARELGGAAPAVTKDRERGGVVVVGGDEVDTTGVAIELESLRGRVPGLRRIGSGPARPFDQRGREIDAVRIGGNAHRLSPSQIDPALDRRTSHPDRDELLLAAHPAA